MIGPYHLFNTKVGHIAPAKPKKKGNNKRLLETQGRG